LNYFQYLLAETDKLNVWHDDEKFLQNIMKVENS